MSNTSQPTRDESETASSDDLAMMESMLCKEQTIYAQHDYFARPLPISPEDNGEMPVDPLCRNIMAKWCSSLCKFCSYDRRMVESVMSCVDRFVATPKGSRILLSRDQYQLAVMASLYLVAKVQQTQALEPDSVAKLSRGKYSKANIEAMELAILSSLKWFVNPPTAMGFAHEFIQNYDFVPEDYDDDSDELSSSSTSSTTEERIMDLVRCQILEATCDYELSCQTRPSHIAFGALTNALQSLNIDSSGLASMRMLKNQLQIIDEDFISTSLLRIVSSSETSSNELSCLLLNRCRGHDSKRIRSSKRSHKEEQKRSCPGSSSSSSITGSPRTVAKGIVC